MTNKEIIDTKSAIEYCNKDIKEYEEFIKKNELT